MPEAAYAATEDQRLAAVRRVGLLGNRCSVGRGSGHGRADPSDPGHASHPVWPTLDSVNLQHRLRDWCRERPHRRAAETCRSGSISRQIQRTKSGRTAYGRPRRPQASPPSGRTAEEGSRVLRPRFRSSSTKRPSRETLPRATFTVLPDVAHVPMLDDPGLVARTILAVTGAAKG